MPSEPHLFEQLPLNLFRPLATAGAPVYADILLTFFAEAVQRHQPFSREYALATVRERLAEQGALEQTDDALAAAAPSDELIPDDEARSARAYVVLRYLEQCGWLKADSADVGYSQVYYLPDYAFFLLRAFTEWTRQGATPLSGLLSAIHDTLTAAIREGDLASRVPQAERQTEQLIAGLQSLYQNMGVYIDRVLEQTDIHAILEEWFSRYRSQISAPAYHALRTTAHVGRYRQGTLQAISQLLVSPELDVAAQQLVERRQAPDAAAARQMLRDQLLRIRDDFNDLDPRLANLDRRHEQFISAVSRTIRLRLAAHTTLSGKLNELIAAVIARETLQAEVAQRLGAYALELVESRSAAPPTSAGQPFAPRADDQPEPTDAEIELARAATLREMERAITRGRIRELAAAWLADRPRRAATDLPLAEAEDLPLLMYIRAYGDGSLGYRVEEGEERVEHGGFAFRQFYLVKT